MNEIEDALSLYEAAREGARVAKRRYEKVTRELFATEKGREWLGLAMARHNFMGSVFDPDDGMNTVAAARRDGVRELISDILNSARAGRAVENVNEEEGL